MIDIEYAYLDSFSRAYYLDSFSRVYREEFPNLRDFALRRQKDERTLRGPIQWAVWVYPHNLINSPSFSTFELPRALKYTTLARSCLVAGVYPHKVAFYRNIDFND